MKNLVSRLIIAATCVFGTAGCQNGGGATAPSPVPTASSDAGTTKGQTTSATAVPAKTACSTLTVTPVTQTVPACGTPMTAVVLTVKANSACAWANNYRVNSSQPSWIYPVPIVFGGAGNGTLRLSLNANYSGATRTGRITLLSAGVTA